MRHRRRTGLLALLVAAACIDADAAPVTAAVDYGPHAVGFRFVTELDQSRAVQPRRSFDGITAIGETAMPIEIGIWYPATASSTGTRMTAEAYKTLRASQPRKATVADFTRMAGFAGLRLSAADATEALTRPTRAVRDAQPEPGSFPLVISGAHHGTGWVRAEYFASHGYVVVAAPGSARTGTLEASQPEIALETQTRNLEFLFAFARQQPFVDATRLGVVGVNFDGLAALVFEMRNMRSNAVISLDGYEAKAGNVDMLRRSPFCDQTRMRVPYLLFVQHERDPPPSLAHDRAIWNSLVYATRFWYVFRDFNHGQLISDVGNVSTLSPEQLAGHVFILRTMRLVLDAYLKGTPPAGTVVGKMAPENGLPAGLAKVADRREALAPAPTGEEFEQLVMSGSLERATRVYRESKAANPELRLFDENTIGLYAFRYSQRKLVKEALEIRQLAAEAFPQSPMAAYQLGVAAADAGNVTDARVAFERALQLLPDGTGSNGLSPTQADDLRRAIEKRRAALPAKH